MAWGSRLGTLAVRDGTVMPPEAERHSQTVRLRGVRERAGDGEGAPEVPPGPAPVGVERFVGLDVVRVFAAITVIWHHAIRAPELKHPESMWHGTWGTSFFNFAAAYLLVASICRRPEVRFGPFAANRFMRLYVPFMIWAVVGLLARLPNDLLLGHTTSTRLNVHLLWHGATYHLWFLPYVMLASLLVFLPVRSILRLGNRRALLATAMVTGVISVAGLLVCPPLAVELQAGGRSEWSVGAGHVVRRFPLFLLGTAFGLLVIAVPAVIGWARRLVPVSLAVAVGSIVARQGFGLLPGTFVRTGALSAFVFGLGLDKARTPMWLARLGRASFGVYLCHFLFIEGAVAAARAAKLPATWQLDLGVFGFATVGAFATVMLLKRSRYTAWMIP